MAGQLAIVAYRSLVDGLGSGSVDIQVQWHVGDDPEEARRTIEATPISTYSNPYGQMVSWELVQIFAIEPFEPRGSGEEVVGFIASTEELSELA